MIHPNSRCNPPNPAASRLLLQAGATAIANNPRAMKPRPMTGTGRTENAPPVTTAGFSGPGLAPYVLPVGETQRNIPEDTVPLKEGTNVLSSNGDHVGDVERLFLEGDSNKVTHFLISQGILFKDRKLVPAHWVKSVEEDKVHLGVSSKVLERLPSYEE